MCYNLGMKKCITGNAYICQGWTKEKEWWKRTKQNYCTKCGRAIKFNGKSYRWIHIK